MHSLEPLNAVTIQHSGVPPATEELTERFCGRACGGVLDMFVGYDNRDLDIPSRDMTTFQTPFGPLRLTKIPMGWTDSVKNEVYRRKLFRIEGSTLCFRIPSGGTPLFL